MTREPGHSSADHLSPGLFVGLTLAALEPDRARAERTRRRCRAVLNRQHTARTRTAARALVLEQAGAASSRPRPAIIGAFCLLCAAYVGELVVTAVRLLGR